MTRHETPLRTPLDGLADILQRGLCRDAMRQITGSAARPKLLRTHFSSRRPVNLVYAQGQHTVLAEFFHDDAEQQAETLRVRLAKTRRGFKSKLDACAVVAVDNVGLVLRRPGLDERLPGLRLLHDPEEARRVVQRIEGGDPGPISPELMAHRLGKRAVLRLTAADGTTRYARLRTDKSSSGEIAYARHMDVFQMVRTDHDLAIPAPLGEDTKLGVGLFAQLHGQLPIFAGLDGFRACHAVSQAILRLQALPLDGLPMHDGVNEAQLLAVWFQRLNAVFPDRAQTLVGAVAEVSEALTTGSTDLVPCHRDLHEKQILIDGNRAGLLDFDTLCLGDPAMDAGNLMAHFFLAGVLKSQPKRAFESAILVAFRHLPARRIKLWRRAAVLRLCMIYAFSDMAPRHLNRLMSEATAPHD